MSRKHFETIASALRADAAHLASGEPFDYSKASAWERGAYDQWSTTVLAIARELAAFNPYFDRERFLSAAGFTGGAR